MKYGYHQIKINRMQFSTKTRYGVRAMIEIALESENEGIFQKDIALKQNISVKYLDHIIAALKVAGLIIPFRGRKSGYKLSRPSNTITILDIHLAFEPGICVVDCLRKGADCEREEICAVVDFWEELNTQIIDYLKSCSLSDLADKKIDILNKLSTKEA